MRKTKEILINNALFVFILFILIIIGNSGIFRQQGLYDGWDLFLPYLFISLIMYLGTMVFLRSKSLSSLGNSSLKYLYLSYLSPLIFYGMLFWDEGLTTIIVYFLLLVIPFLNKLISNIYVKKVNVN